MSFTCSCFCKDFSIYLSGLQHFQFLLYTGFGGALGAPAAGLNLGGGVRSFLASQERFLTTLLWMAQLTQ